MDRLASCFSLYSVGHLGSLITSIFEPKDDHGWAVMSGKFYANHAFNIIIGWIASSDDLAKKMDNWAVKRSTELATAELAALSKEVDSELHVNASDLTREKIDACNPTVVASLITKRLPLYTQLVVEPALAVVSKVHRKRKKDSDEAGAEIELRRLKMLSSIAEILFVMNRRYNRLQTGVTISLWTAQARRPAFALLNNLGTCFSYESLLKCLESLTVDTQKLLKKVPRISNL